MNTSQIKNKFSFFKNDFQNGILKFDSVLKKFQDIATIHAKILNIDFDEMLKKNLLWVTLRIKYQVLSQPEINEKLTISTFPSGKTLLEFDRDFVIKSTRGVLITGSSKWCLIDKDTRRIAKIANLPSLENLTKPSVFDGKFLKTEIFDTSELKPVFEYTIKNDDIDKNGHMNNTKYAKIVQNNFSVNKLPTFFQINFLKEAMLNDKIYLYQKQIDEKILFLGKLENDEISFSGEILFD